MSYFCQLTPGAAPFALTTASREDNNLETLRSSRNDESVLKAECGGESRTAEISKEDGNVMQQLQASQAQREPTSCAANEADSNGLEEEKQPQIQSPEGDPRDAREDQSAAPLVRESYVPNGCVHELLLEEPSGKICTPNPLLEIKTARANKDGGDIPLIASEAMNNHHTVKVCLEINLDSKGRDCKRLDTKGVLPPGISEACGGFENQTSQDEIQGGDNNNDCIVGEKDGDLSTSRSDANSSNYQSAEDGHEGMETSVMLVMHQALCNSIRKICGKRNSKKKTLALRLIVRNLLELIDDNAKEQLGISSPHPMRFYEAFSRFYVDNSEIVTSDIEPLCAPLRGYLDSATVLAILLVRWVFATHVPSSVAAKYGVVVVNGASRAFWSDVRASAYSFRPLFKILKSVVEKGPKGPLIRLPSQSRTTLPRLLAQFLLYYEPANALPQAVSGATGSLAAVLPKGADEVVDSICVALTSVKTDQALIRILSRTSALPIKDLDLTSTTRIRLEAALWALGRPGGPLYPPSNVRAEAARSYSVLFPVGRRTRWLATLAFRLLYPHHFAGMIYDAITAAIPTQLKEKTSSISDMLSGMLSADSTPSTPAGSPKPAPGEMFSQSMMNGSSTENIQRLVSADGQMDVFNTLVGSHTVHATEEGDGKPQDGTIS